MNTKTTNNILEYENLDYIEVDLLQDIYKSIEVERDGEYIEDYKLVKKDVRSKKVIWKSEISDVKQVINEKGNIRTKRVEIGIKYKDSPLIVEGNYKDIKRVVFSYPKREERYIGFKFY